MKTDSSGWLYDLGVGHREASKKKDDAWKFISWASGKEYESWSARSSAGPSVPAGKRASTYENPEYLKAAARSPSRPGSASRTRTRRTRACSRGRPRDPVRRHPRVHRPRHQVSQDVSSAIAGQNILIEALSKGQEAAQKIGNKYK